MPAAPVDHSQRICVVWACQLDEEMKKIHPIIWKYNYVAMDTEFPGVVARPIGEFRSNTSYQYQILWCNVDLLKIIQLGLTFMNEQKEYPPRTSTWQFHFKFNLPEDMYAQNSIELLTISGIQFKKTWGGRNWDPVLCRTSYDIGSGPVQRSQMVIISQWLWLWLFNQNPDKF